MRATGIDSRRPASAPVRADTGYPIGHPWHYVLGGDIPSPEQILAYVASDYRGYREGKIERAHNAAEPRRSMPRASGGDWSYRLNKSRETGNFLEIQLQ